MKSDYNKPAKVGWTPGWDEAYERAFGRKCPYCQEKGYYEDWDDVMKKYIKTTCLICQGRGRIK
jgi:hypothetical protein